jgi:hypothetical protein
MASGLCAALTGRTHGCTDQPANVKKTLANSEPSTHGTELPFRRRRPMSEVEGKTDSTPTCRKRLSLTQRGHSASHFIAMQAADLFQSCYSLP